MAHNNRKPNMLPYTLKDFQKQFPDDATCLEWLRNYLYPDGIFCDACSAVTKHHRDKTPVVGMVQRKGQVRAFVAADVKADTLNGLIKEHVLPKSVVFTDTFGSYNGLQARGYVHERINHSEKVYVVGNIHTNTIEGFWSLIKRGIGGVYHNVGRHYLQTYLNEYSFRYNRRFDTQPMLLSFF